MTEIGNDNKSFLLKNKTTAQEQYKKLCQKEVSKRVSKFFSR